MLLKPKPSDLIIITSYHSKACRYLQSGQAWSDDLQKPDYGPQSGPGGSYKSEVPSRLELEGLGNGKSNIDI